MHHLDAALALSSSTLDPRGEGLNELLVDALIAAGEAASRTEMPRAIPFLTRALDALPDGDQRRLSSTRLLAMSHHAAGDLTMAADLLEEAFSLYRSRGDVEDATDIAIDLGAAPLVTR